ncbi:MAG: calcium-binding protein [Gemmobacter sp.]
MELLLLLLPLALLGFAFGGGSDDDGFDAEPQPDTRIQAGTDASETLRGGPADDLIFGARGADTLLGRGGFDILVGEAGDDSLNGGDDGDILLGGGGNDTLIGGPDGDALIGGAGDDLLYGGAGDDDIWGGSGEDVIYGGPGDDLISSLDPRGTLTPEFNTARVGNVIGDILTERYGPEAAERFLPRVQNAIYSATPGDTESDLVYGGPGDDDIFADLGDRIVGGAGVDLYVVFHAAGEEPVSVVDYEAGEPIRLVTNAPETGQIAIAEDGGGNLRISFGGSTFLILENTALATLNPADIVVRFDDVPFARAA